MKQIKSLSWRLALTGFALTAAGCDPISLTAMGVGAGVVLTLLVSLAYRLFA